MGDNSEPGAPETLESQSAALLSSSTNLRIETLRKLLHEIQDPGAVTVICTEMATNALQAMSLDQDNHWPFCPLSLQHTLAMPTGSLVVPCNHASEHT